MMNFVFKMMNFSRRDQIFLMGYTVRTDAWRYTVWFDVLGISRDEIMIQTDRIIGRELYDHTRDPGGASFDRDGENVNLVGEAQYEDVVNRHHALILSYIKLPTATGRKDARPSLG